MPITATTAQYQWLCASSIQAYIHSLKNYKRALFLFRSWDSSAGMAPVYGLDARGSIPDTGKKFFANPQCPDRLWNPPSLPYNG
jgi:hypothetical protein